MEFQNIGQYTIYDIGLTVVSLIAAAEFFSGVMTVGQFINVQGLFFQLRPVLIWQGWYMRQFAQTTNDVRDLFHMLKSEPIVREKDDAQPFEYKEGRLKFNNLTFKHYFATESEEGGDSSSMLQVKERVLLNDFNLEVEPGTTNAIVGPSGFGKTTLFNLLFRIYEPESGNVEIDGQNVADLKFQSFRKYVSMVPQNGSLFNDSILFNLKYSNPDATMEEII
mmetsp:Transcript_14140/g.24009  ORF Transcript_14140/g.24009 Transcript_14140/m.24009 type:complete len:222 (-) Transcript_14140:617-1282(-)